MKITQTQTGSSKKKALWIVIAAVILTGLIAVGVYAFTHQSSTTNPAEDTRSTDQKNQEDPTYSSDKNKDEQNQTDTPMTQTPDAPKKDVTVGIAYAGPAENNIEARAFISGVIEGTGTCTATFTKGSERVTGASKAFIDATTSQCEPIVIAKSQFKQSGMWSVVVSYESPTSKGSSPALEVEL